VTSDPPNNGVNPTLARARLKTALERGLRQTR
jgi:hypothetical protein